MNMIVDMSRLLDLPQLKMHNNSKLVQITTYVKFCVMIKYEFYYYKYAYEYAIKFIGDKRIK